MFQCLAHSKDSVSPSFPATVSPSQTSITGSSRKRVAAQDKPPPFSSTRELPSPPASKLLGLTEIHGQGDGLGALGNAFSLLAGKAPCPVLINHTNQPSSRVRRGTRPGAVTSRHLTQLQHLEYSGKETAFHQSQQQKPSF